MQLNLFGADLQATKTLPGSWRAFTADHDEADAAGEFRRRYGRPPDRLIRRSGLLFVGPIQQQQDHQDERRASWPS